MEQKAAQLSFLRALFLMTMGLFWVLTSACSMWAHDGQSLLGVVEVNAGGREVSVEFEVSLEWLLASKAGEPAALFVEEGKEHKAVDSPAERLREMLELEVAGAGFWPQPQVAYVDVEGRGGVEKHAVFTFAGDVTGEVGAEDGVVVRLKNDAPFSLVLLFERDGVQERRSQVLYQGEGSRVYPLNVSEEVVGQGSSLGVEEDVLLPVVAEESGSAFMEYLRVGFRHIMAGRRFADWGWDHILFVLALFFLSSRWRPLFLQITCFTVAHTLTLGMGAAGWLQAPSWLVEPAIAASIAFVALENVWRERLGAWRIGVVILFGLLHGMGFAGFLSEVGLREGEFVPGLAGFNVGVELGQLLVVLIASLLLYPWRVQPWYRQKIAVPASLVIAGIGLWWAFQRVFLAA